MNGDLKLPQICMPSGRRAQPPAGRSFVDLTFLKGEIGTNAHTLRDLARLFPIQTTQCDFTRNICCCKVVFAAELYPAQTTLNRNSVYHFFYGPRWRFFWELCRQPPLSRCLYEVIAPESMINFFMDIDMDKPSWLFADSADVGWPAMWLEMCRKILPIVDNAVQVVLADCMNVDRAELLMYCSVGVLPETCSTSTGSFANIPGKWSVHMVWKHPNRHLSDIGEARSIFDVVSRSLRRPLIDVLPAEFGTKYSYEASELHISSVIDSRVYTQNRMFRTLGCVKLNKEQRVLVPCDITPTFQLKTGGIDIHVWQEHLVTTPLRHSSGSVAASSRGLFLTTLYLCTLLHVELCVMLGSQGSWVFPPYLPGVRGGSPRGVLNISVSQVAEWILAPLRRRDTLPPHFTLLVPSIRCTRSHKRRLPIPVSYTHLTLPTILLV